MTPDNGPAADLHGVPRDLFVPVHSDAADDADEPDVVAAVLEQLDPGPGHNVFVAGAGTGYNAALIAAVVGEHGHVTTLDGDPDTVDAARAHLAAAGVTNVDVVLADPARGHPADARYDRVIATVGVHDIPTAWLHQLAPGGRLLVPLRLRGATTRRIAFERESDGWHGVNSEPAAVMPGRGIGADGPQRIHLTDDHTIGLQVHRDQTVDAAALTGVFDTGRHERWTGVLFPGEALFAWIDLWLACTLDNALMRMDVALPAAHRGIVAPSFNWGSMATVRGADLAYLTTRPASFAPDGIKLYEAGVVGHGPTGEALADETADQIQHWNTHCRNRTVTFTMPTVLPATDPAAGRFVLPRKHNPVVVTWT
ncbi:methyltransferase, FxLD system [Dactylosporangium sucinum]|uniref:methyltransferase, FxLD system n=1 Tax=Dactylosporangium sucinum TaxID=1424081 RepID=UPI00167E9F06|nr:methyltransferase, FxLD system [Dactylosporangium sucinum]